MQRRTNCSWSWRLASALRKSEDGVCMPVISTYSLSPRVLLRRLRAVGTGTQQQDRRATPRRQETRRTTPSGSRDRAHTRSWKQREHTRNEHSGLAQWGCFEHTVKALLRPPPLPLLLKSHNFRISPPPLPQKHKLCTLRSLYSVHGRPNRARKKKPSFTILIPA